MQSGRLEDALDRLQQAIGEVEAIVAEMRSNRDPLALYVFDARRSYRKIARDTKSGTRHETAALVSFKQATELRFTGTLHDWQRPLVAGSNRHFPPS
jgi:hypothetical protein